uniref:Uncharacterized protein n=1 Tax=Anopheles culicifacies TaxID=139723 RepID=A0A182MBS0_9DIPT
MLGVRLCGALLVVILVLHLTLAIGAKRYGSVGSSVRPFQLAGKVKRETVNDDRVVEDDGEDDKIDSSEKVIYDQRQVNGETNIRLTIKNVQLQLPESQLALFQKTNMAQLIRNSVLRLLGIEVTEPSEAPQASSRRPPVQPNPSSTEKQPIENLAQSLPDISASMLQVNGNNLPAKFFLEISDFLMNTNDNDAVDDMRVETNHNQQQQLEQQQLEQQLHRFQQQQQQNHPSSQQPPEPLFATEEIKIERLENTSNVRNQTITISKKRHQVGPLPMDGSAVETVSKENHHSTNTTRNATETSDRFVETKPIRLDTVQAASASYVPKTLREKVIWKMPEDVTGDETDGQ